MTHGEGGGPKMGQKCPVLYEWPVPKLPFPDLDEALFAWLWHYNPRGPDLNVITSRP